MQPTTPGRLVYDSGQKWLSENDPRAVLAEWGQIRAIERQYWESLAKAIQTAVSGHRWDGFFCGLTFGFLTAALVFIAART